jgi:hypothetical protein
MDKRGLLFGINYVKTPEVRLRGCHNDVHNMSKVLKDKYGFGEVKVHVDDTSASKSTTASGILQEINDLAVECHKENIQVVWIHFSGHGTRVRDWDHDENDGYDEALVPSDYTKSGLISDDYIKRVLRNFPVSTKVICCFDCCHSGSIADLKYRYGDKESCIIENNSKACDANIVMISGCTDTQTSADAFDVNNRRKFSGACSSCLISTLEKHDNPLMFTILDELRDELKNKGFSQIPMLTSSIPIGANTKLFG